MIPQVRQQRVPAENPVHNNIPGVPADECIPAAHNIPAAECIPVAEHIPAHIYKPVAEHIPARMYKPVAELPAHVYEPVAELPAAVYTLAEKSIAVPLAGHCISETPEYKLVAAVPESGPKAVFEPAERVLPG